MSHAGQSLRYSGVSDRIGEFLPASVATAISRFRKAAHRRELVALSDRQLRDAGIDPSLAGRGKATAVNVVTLCRLPHLS